MPFKLYEKIITRYRKMKWFNLSASIFEIALGLLNFDVFNTRIVKSHNYCSLFELESGLIHFSTLFNKTQHYLTKFDKIQHSLTL